jgi:RNA polymerase sigma factor (sigma-70 family)
MGLLLSDRLPAPPIRRLAGLTDGPAKGQEEISAQVLPDLAAPGASKRHVPTPPPLAYDVCTQEGAGWPCMEGEEFLRRMRAGDASVWEALMPAMRVIALGACRDLKVFDELREDVVQDVAFKVFTDWASYRGDSKLGTWIYAIARHRCLDELRKRAVRGDDRVVVADDDEAMEDAGPSWHPDMAQSLCVQQVLRELESQGEARKGSKRMIDVLLWWVGNSPSTEELAAFLATSVAAAKERKSYILRSIKELCRKYCGHDECALAAAV